MSTRRHRHHHIDPDAGDRRVLLAVVVNVGLTFAQLAGGILSGSLALIADAMHNLSDAIALIIAFAARKIARRPSSAQMTFGYRRVEIVAALVNYTTLILVGFYLAYEAVLRFFEPQSVLGWPVIIIAGIALIVDVATALLTYALSKESINIRAAFLHNIADALGSVAVIISGIIILIYDWRLIDPLVTLMISGYILWHSLSEIGPVIRMLMLGSPPDIEFEIVIAQLEKVDGLDNIHSAHLWQMNEHDNAFDAHLVIHEGKWNEADAIKTAAKTLLAKEFDIHHTTLEIECSHHACANAKTLEPAA